MYGAKRFFAIFTATLSLCMLIWILLVLGEFGHPTQMSQWIYDVYAKKQKIAQEIEGRKIVVVAGSNALFGIDSQMLEKAFGLPVVNYGVNAGIELPCTLFMAQKVIQRGDIVLLPLEYPMYFYGGRPGVQMIDFLLAREPSCFGKLTLREQLYIFWHISLKRLREGYGKYEEKPIRSGLYGAHHVDSHGDQNETALQYRTAGMYAEVLEHDRHPEKYGETFDTKALGWCYLTQFVRWCKKRDARVVFMPSTLMWHKSYEKNPQEKYLYMHIAQEVRRRGWIFVGNPYDYMYDKSLYFNTNFHLIAYAREMRTKQMIRDLVDLPFFQKRCSQSKKGR